MRKLIALFVLAFGSSMAREATALDKSDLAALRVAVHDLCVAPDKKGEYLKIEGDSLKVAGVSERAKSLSGNIMLDCIAF